MLSPRRVVLLVEDDDDSRDALRTLLEGEGIFVVAFGDARSALRWLEGDQEEPCFVIVDFLMPGMSGVDFIKAVRQRDGLRTLPPAIVTGWSIAEVEAPDDVAVLIKPNYEGLIKLAREHCAAA